ncbi:MAG: BON domain-containing protein [Betaproteobacteria bacterium]|nr:BON domain-containing protein [Betaproteobacteria bacterium]
MRVLLLLAAAALGLPEANAQSQPSAWFRKLDRNRDGYLQRGEIAQMRGVARAFDEADADHDGKLTPQEFIDAEVIAHSAKLPALPQDKPITEKVRRELAREPELKEVGLGVRTHRGRVTLSGKVRDESQRELAIKTASAVEGVSAVGDAMTLR